MGEAGGATVGELGGVDGTSEPWMIVPPFVPVFATESLPEVSSTEDAVRFARNSSAAADEAGGVAGALAWPICSAVANISFIKILLMQRLQPLPNIKI